MNRKNTIVLNFEGFTIRLFTTKRGYKTTEHAQIIKNLEILSEARYIWENRPWQSGTYHNAIISACNKLKIGYDEILKSL